MPAWQKRLVILSCFIAIAVLVLCYIFLPDYVYSSGANMRSTDFPKKVGVIELYPIVAIVSFFYGNCLSKFKKSWHGYANLYPSVYFYFCCILIGRVVEIEAASFASL